MTKHALKLLSQFILLCCAAGAATLAEATKQRNIHVQIQTNYGNITLELYPKQAPATVANFLKYAESGFYDDTIFHRVIPGFVVQGGGFDKNMIQKKTNPPIVNESDNGLKNKRGTLSMARTTMPDSATSQFFINLKDNPSLDFQPGRPGYAVFAKIIDGMDVVDEMAKVKTGNHGFHENVPAKPIIITRISVKFGTT